MPNETVLTPTDNQPAPGSEQTPTNTQAETPAAPAADWRAALPEDLRGEKMFENIKAKDAAEALPHLAKGYRDAQKLIGGSMGKIPGKDAKPEEIKAWRDQNLPKLREAGLVDGPPADPSGYTVKPTKGGVPVEVVSTSMYAFNKLAFDMGLSNAQAQQMMDAYMNERDQLGGSATETYKELTKEWGAGVHTQVRSAQQAVREVGGDELIEVLESTGLGNHPALIKAFARVGAILAEDNPVFKDTVRTDEADATAQRTRILNDRKHAYWNSEDPGHKAAVAEVAKLNQIIYAQGG